MARKKGRSRKKKTGGLGSMTNKILNLAIPIGYGYVRDGISDKLANTAIVQQLPATNFTDEGVMLGLNMIATKIGARNNVIARKFLQTHEDIELSRVGQTISDLRQLKGQNGATASNSGALLF
jgi:hypothetical protein